jgi:L-seryl-tRNA(Ser) seleniumtransferase
MPDETLLVLLDEVRGRTLRFLQGVTAEQARWAPPGLQNSILWHAGHCYILAEWLGAGPLGQEPHAPEGWFAMFGWESRPASVPAGRWPPMNLVVSQLVDQHRRLRRAVREATEDRLAAPNLGNPDRTVRWSVVHGLHDEACHGGEILLLRKLQGLSRPRGPRRNPITNRIGLMNQRGEDRMARRGSRRAFFKDAAAVTAAGAAAGHAGSEASAATPPDPGVYTRIGVRPLINGMGTVTVVGGSLMPPEVLQAMAEAARFFVPLPELQVKVGARIAELLGVPAALVTAGAASAITVATAACVTRGDAEALNRLPDTAGLRNEVILQKSHRTGYEPQILLAGAKLVWVETRQELEGAISDRTAMMFFMDKADPGGRIRRREWIQVGKARGVPTVNDAAADLPPASRLTSYVKEGWDLVIFSGGKALLGPQCAGLLLGRKDLVEAGRPAISPSLGIGRGMKVGKEEMVGLLAAVERYLKLDHEAERREWAGRVAEMIGVLSRVPGLDARCDVPEYANRVPHLVLGWGEGAGWPSAGQVVKSLRDGDPPIAVLAEGERGLRVAVWTMQGTEHRVVARRLEEVFRGK